VSAARERHEAWHQAMLPQRRQPPPILAATAQSTLKFPAPAGGLRAAPPRSQPSGRGKARSPKVARADSSGALRLSQPLPPSPRRARTKCEIRLTPGVAPDSLNPLRRHNILGCARQAGPKHWGWRRQAATADIAWKHADGGGRMGEKRRAASGLQDTTTWTRGAAHAAADVSPSPRCRLGGSAPEPPGQETANPGVPA
jgi:hypothetical protein